MISGFRNEANEKCVLLGLQRSKNPKSLNPLPLKMRKTGCPETSVRNYHYSLRNNQEQRKFSSTIIHDPCRKTSHHTYSKTAVYYGNSIHQHVTELHVSAFFQLSPERY